MVVFHINKTLKEDDIISYSITLTWSIINGKQREVEQEKIGKGMEETKIKRDRKKI